MAENTDYLGLTLYDDSTDLSKTFAEYRSNISGLTGSNFTKIDEFCKNIPAPPIRLTNFEQYKTNLSGITSSLDGWTVNGSATVAGDKISIFGASSHIQRAVSLSKIEPTLITGEIELVVSASGYGVRLLTSAEVSAGGIARGTGGASLILQGAPSGTSSLPLNSAVRHRFYLLFDPIVGKVRGWLQDNGDDGPKYIGEQNSTGVYAILRVFVGSSADASIKVSKIDVYPIQTVIIGDSRVAGANEYNPYPDKYGGVNNPEFTWMYWLNKLTGVSWLNSGVGSTNSAQNLARITTQAINFKPKFVILGPSNFSETAQTLIDNYIAMTVAVKNAGIAPILMEQPPVIASRGWGDRISVYNSWVRDYSRQNGILLIRVFDAMNNGSGELIPAFTSDGTHLTALGCEFVANRIMDSIG